MKNVTYRRGAALLALVVALLAGVWFSTGVRTANAAYAVAADATPLAIPNPVQLSSAFSRLAKELEPSVVLVTSTMQERRTSTRMMPRGGDDGQEGDPGDLFHRFFGGQPFEMPRPRRTQATGSGFVVDRNGYILTNNHVVDGAARVQVKLDEDNTEYNAKVVGTDPELDLAVLKISAPHALPTVKVGNSDAVQVGDWAVAIGSPFGLEATVTAGIISAKGRDLGDRGHELQRFLQTDAAINPGNSGGPLLNINGEVIGINTMIATDSGGYQGVGFALPINLAVNAYNQIIKTGKVSRGAIGILFNREPNPALLKVYGAKEGVFVQQVTPGSPSDKAGLKEGDVITSFNGKPVKSGDDLVARVSESPVGSRVPVTILRDGKSQEVTLEIGDRSAIVARESGRPEITQDESPKGQAVKFGVSVRNLRPEDRESAGLPAHTGVVISSVDSGSFADDIGVQQGDVLTAINRQPVSSVDDVRRIAGTLKAGDAVVFKVMRNTSQGRRAEWTAIFAAGTLPNS